MIDVKEKLVELIAKAKEIYAGDYTDHTEDEYIAEMLLDNGVTVQDGKDNDVPTKWIPVTERLPEDFISVLVFVPSLDPLPMVHKGYYVSKESQWGVYSVGILNRHAVTHWMPLPEPPKGE